MCKCGKNGCSCGTHSDKEKSMPPRPDINKPKSTQEPKKEEHHKNPHNPHKK